MASGLPKEIKTMISEHQIREGILDYLKEDDSGIIDQETLLYFKDRYKFSHTEFRDFCQYLIRLWPEWPKNKSKFFEEYVFCFNYNKFDFIVRLLIGQGSALQLINPQKKILKILKIKFDKKNKIKLKSLAPPIKL